MSRRTIGVVVGAAAALALLPGVQGEAPRDAGQWTAASALPDGARQHAASVLLPDGRVLVLGGRGDDGALASDAIYAGAAWTSAPATIERWGLTATRLADGRVLIAGGESAAGLTSVLDLYDPATGSLTPAGSLLSPRRGHAATLLADGRVLIAGGFDGAAVVDSVEIYDPSDGSTVAASFALSVARAGLSATTLHDGRVLLAGGNDGHDDLAIAELVTVATGAVTVRAMSAAHRDHAAVLLPYNNHVLLTGGTANGEAAGAELFRPWTGEFISTAAPLAPRAGATASALAEEGWALVAGGDAGGTAERYAFATVRTDYDDYWPGDVVHVSGSGWQPNERVVFGIREVPAEHEARTVTITADAHGIIANATLFTVEEHHLGVRFYLTARGAASQAQTTFTDGNKATFSTSATGAETADFGPVAPDTCISAFVQERQGNTIEPAPSNRVVTLSSTPAGATFHAAAGCSGAAITSDTIAATTSSKQFWFKNAATASYTIAGNAGFSGSNNASSAVTVNPIYTLTVTATGAGHGTVTSLPAGINCTSAGSTTGGTCSAGFASGTIVTLTATPSGAAPTAAGSTFDGWSGDGAGSTTRSVTMNAAKAVSAKFKANQTITFAALTGRTYGDLPFGVSATATSGLAVSFSSLTTGVCQATGTSVSVLAPGTCTVRASQPGDAADYNAAANVDQSFAVAAKALTPHITADDKVYDGTAAATITGRSLTGIVGTDDVTLTGGSATFADKHVGTGKVVTGTGFTLSGTAASNYVLSPASATTTATITAAGVTGAITAGNKIYDGLTAAAITGRTITSGIFGTDVVTLQGGSATFADKHVGTAKTITATGFTLGGADAGNYALSPDTITTTADITARALAVGATGQDKEYDGTTAATVSLSDDRVAGDALTTAYATASFDNKNVGTGKTVSVTGITIGGADAGNYTFNATTTTTADITPRALAVTASADNKVYDGHANATVTLADDRLGADVFSVAFATATFDTKQAGTGKTVTVSGITLSGTDAANYTANATATTTADITPRALVVNATGVDKVYDGGATATVTFTDDRVSGDVFTIAYTAAFADKNVGAGKPVSVSAIALAGPDAGNYTPNTTDATAASITPRALIVSAVAADKVYDGTTTAAVTLSDDRLAGDLFTAGYASAAFADANAGMGKLVTVTGIALSGVDAGNYAANTLATATANITPRPLAVTADAKSKPFGAADPPFTYQITGGSLVSGDSLTGALTRIGVGTPAGEAVGVHPILQGTLTAGPNYALTYHGANLTIAAWTLTGFYQPVSMTAGVWNTVKGGSTVPLKFNLYETAGGTELTSTSDVLGFSAIRIGCTAAPEDPVEVFQSTGGSSLRYDATSGQFVQNWQTPKGAGLCYQVTMTARDLSTIVAVFKTK